MYPAAADNGDDNKNCTPRSVNNFPGNFFTLAETQDGGVFIHILISLYLFAALGIVCDDYFVPALERICEGRIRAPSSSWIGPNGPNATMLEY